MKGGSNKRACAEAGKEGERRKDSSFLGQITAPSQNPSLSRLLLLLANSLTREWNGMEGRGAPFCRAQSRFLPREITAGVPRKLPPPRTADTGQEPRSPGAGMQGGAAVTAAGAEKGHREWRCLSIRGAPPSDPAAASSRRLSAAPRPPPPGRSERRRRRRRGACSLLGRRLFSCLLQSSGAAVTAGCLLASVWLCFLGLGLLACFFLLWLLLWPLPLLLLDLFLGF